MSTIKLLHVSCAYITGLGFLLRGILALARHPLQNHRITRRLPHLIDTVLLVSGFLMLWLWSFAPLQQSWLLAKLLVLPAYIGAGFLMLRWGSNDRRRVTGLACGLLLYAYMVGAAHSKSALSLLALL